MYACVQDELPLYALPSDRSTTNKENIRSVICVSTSIHLVYVSIPSKGINQHALTSIHLVYVRIPGKEITMYWLAHI